MKKADDLNIPFLDEKSILGAPTISERRTGRPRGTHKTQMNLRIDRDVFEWLKHSGQGYQTRLNEMLRKIMALSPGHLKHRFS